jgi:hypothetical protein
MLVVPADFGVDLFLLPGGLPRLLAVISAIQDGGRPRLRPRPLAKRSRLKIASSICSRSWRNSTRIFATSILFSPENRLHLSFTVMREEYQASIGIFEI